MSDLGVLGAGVGLGLCMALCEEQRCHKHDWMDVPRLLSAKSFYPLLSLSLCSASFSVLFLQPVGALPVIPVRRGPRLWGLFPVLMHTRLSRAPCKCPLIWGASLARSEHLLSGQVGFIPLGYLLCTLAGDEKTTATAGAAFLEGMGQLFHETYMPTSVLCKSCVSEGSGRGYPVLLCAEIP